ncbi:uncharacterized protein LOC131637172 [Vicia villosa]|uniref:uncharacterized protein LOC131637172 n=1 Tax=Vicia villosa TaxID=3911 RepID=UPI00273BD1BA|nr:uncharacterized protein LOC131637172 [Vicia villosa]
MEWRHDFSMEKDMLRSIPIWIKLPSLPLPLWGVQSLGKIGSTVGNPLFINECTVGKLRVSYARLLVEVDVTQKLCEEVTIKDHEGKIRQQKVEYEWRPKFCERCQRVGHVCSTERKLAVRTWQLKTKKSDEQETTSQSEQEDGHDAKEKTKKDNAEQSPKGESTRDIAEQTLQEKKKWTKIKRRKEDGKKPSYECPPGTSLVRSNVFESLGVMNDPRDTPLGVT